MKALQHNLGRIAARLEKAPGEIAFGAAQARAA
jgi:hypothetical protein